jgi:hypothetical protein
MMEENYPSQIIVKKDLTLISKLLLDPDGLIITAPYEVIMSFGRDTILYFCLVHGIYCLPTSELIEFLASQIVGNAIEIGCGNGAIGRLLHIPITDSCLQERPEMKMYYNSLDQPVIQYPKDVIRLSADFAVSKFKPDTVIAAYVTHKWDGKTGSVFGVVEGKIVSAGTRYIFVGNDNIHSEKPILKHAHQTLRFPWLITRSEPEKNFIKIWN